MKWLFPLVLVLAGSANAHSDSRHLDEVGMCGAREFTAEEMTDVNERLAARESQQSLNSSFATMQPPFTIPVYVHVLQESATVGALTDDDVKTMVAFLQQEYDFSLVPFKFELQGTTRHINAGWYACGPEDLGGNEKDFKPLLRQGGKDALNVYTCNTFAYLLGLLGWGVFRK